MDQNFTVPQRQAGHRPRTSKIIHLEHPLSDGARHLHHQKRQIPRRTALLRITSSTTEGTAEEKCENVARCLGGGQ